MSVAPQPGGAAGAVPGGGAGARREVSAPALELLLLEAARRWGGEAGPAGDGGAAVSAPAGHELEALGARVGAALAERCSRDRPRFADHLDVIKFLCKEVWAEAFVKQVDNLKTNHRGVYVLHDNAFRWLRCVPEGPGASEDAHRHLRFPAGVVQGALTALGVPATVTAEAAAPPAASFTVRIRSAT